MSPAENLIRALNDAWLADDFDAIAACYHADVILLPPDAGVPIIGRDAVVSTYREFSNQARLKDFQVTELLTYPVDGLSAIHMRFDVEYQLDEAVYQESGLDVYWVNATPLIIWRHQMTLGGN